MEKRDLPENTMEKRLLDGVQRLIGKGTKKEWKTTCVG